MPRIGFLVFFSFSWLIGIVQAHAEVRTSHLWGLPPCVTVMGHQIDRLLIGIAVLTGAVFLLTQTVWIFSLIRYRYRPGKKAHYSHGSLKMEIAWTVIPGVIFLGLFLISDHLWSKLIRPPVAGTALDIEVVGEQYDWMVRYPGADGILGRAEDDLSTPLNKIGLDPSDPHGVDDLHFYNQMVVPVGRRVHLHLRSRDVIHGFYIPEFRLYQDLVPGRTISWVSFEADRVGEFSINCAQLCGAGHDTMQGRIRVVTASEFDVWYRDQMNLQHSHYP